MTLTEFLLARIAEDEAVARTGVSGQADPERGWGLIEYQGRPGVTLSPHVGHIHERIQGEHIIRWHPYRVLAECEAKRRIVEDLALPYIAERRRLMNGQPSWGDEHPDILLLLALPYADRPGFREEWRP